MVKRNWKILCGILFVIILAIVVAWMAGCGLTTEKQSLIEQQQRESISSKTTADVVTAAKTTPADIRIKRTEKDGTVLEVTQPAATNSETRANTSAEENSDSRASGNQLDTELLPWGTKVILAAVGIALLAAVVFGIIWLVKRSSAAANAAWQFADTQLANQIHSIRSRVMAETNPAEGLKLATIAADLERDRVNLLKD